MMVRRTRKLTLVCDLSAMLCNQKSQQNSTYADTSKVSGNLGQSRSFVFLKMTRASSIVVRYSLSRRKVMHLYHIIIKKKKKDEIEIHNHREENWRFVTFQGKNWSNFPGCNCSLEDVRKAGSLPTHLILLLLKRTYYETTNI